MTMRVRHSGTQIAALGLGVRLGGALAAGQCKEGPGGWHNRSAARSFTDPEGGN